MNATDKIYRLLITVSISAIIFGCDGKTDKDDPTVSSIDITSTEDYEQLYADNPGQIEPDSKAQPLPESKQEPDHSESGGSDNQAYDLGRSCALRLIRQCETESEVRDELLDIRAREYGIRSQVGDEAANAYLSGFKSALKESGDTLYGTLFE